MAIHASISSVFSFTLIIIQIDLYFVSKMQPLAFLCIYEISKFRHEMSNVYSFHTNRLFDKFLYFFVLAHLPSFIKSIPEDYKHSECSPVSHHKVFHMQKLGKQ